MSRATESLPSSPELSPEFHGRNAAASARAAIRMPSNPRDIGTGIALAAFGAIAFSGKAIIVKLAYRYGTDAITLIALRMLCALPFFLAMGAWAATRPGTVPLTRREGVAVIVLGFLGYYLASYLDFLGLEYVSASLERLILYLNPTIVLFIGLLFFKRRVQPRQIVALAVGYAGVVIAFAHDFRVGGSNVALGSMLVFASALTYALYLVGSGELVKRVGTMRLTAYASSVAALCCIVQFLLTRPLSTFVELPTAVYGLSLLNGTACTVLPVFAVMAGVSRLGASIASQVGMIGPVSTIILAQIFLGEHMGPTQVIGTILVMVGVFIVSQTRPANKTVPLASSGAPASTTRTQGERSG
jgi:drug/metabolite transporter (DMT)-like permease